LFIIKTKPPYENKAEEFKTVQTQHTYSSAEAAYIVSSSNSGRLSIGHLKGVLNLRRWQTVSVGKARITEKS